MVAYALDEDDVKFFRKLHLLLSDGSGIDTKQLISKIKKEDQPSSLVAQFIVKSVEDDSLTCRTWDGSYEGGTDITVMKPYLLRKTPFDGLSFTDWQEMEQGETNCTVSYQSSTQRRLTFNSTNRIREQIVTPTWLVEDGSYKGDLIYACSSVVGRLDGLNDTIWVELSSERRWQNEVPDASILSAFTVGSTGEAETADTSTLDIWKNVMGGGSPSNGYRLINLTRIAFDATGDAKLFAYYRVIDIRWDGRIALIGAESRIEIADTEVCP